MLKEGNSRSTIGIYTRGLRVFFNKAVNDEVISSEFYPFVKGGYEIQVRQLFLSQRT